MSDRELRRLEVLQDLNQGRLTPAAAGQLLGLERRQVFRLLKAYRIEGPTGLISKRRGRRSNRRKPEALRRAVLTIIRQWYWDFGPTLAAEKLREDHGIAVGRETLRQWMIEAELWRDRKQRRHVHQPRPRRECVGELVQVDGSEHWWFEDRGPQCTLLVFVDDATSRLMHLQFVESESTFAYFHAARAYLEAWGKPVAFYSDKHGVFRVNHPGALGGDGMTQFGRALHALNIDIISPIRVRPRAGSSGRTRRCRIGSSRSCGLPGSAPSLKEMPCYRRSWPITMRALPSRRRIGRTCTGRCAPVTIWRTLLPGRSNADSPRR